MIELRWSTYLSGAGRTLLEISEHGEITQIKLSREVNGEPLFWVSAYLVDDVLIDTGCIYTSLSLLDFLKDRSVTRVINTHHHEDHVGANRLLQEKLGVQVLAHELALDYIKHPPALPHYREQAWGYPDGSDCEPCPSSIKTRRFNFDVIYTPGHCPGHISLIEKDQGWIFSGDLFIGGDLRVAGPETDVSEMLESMRKLLAVESEEFTLFTSLRTVRRDGRKALNKFVSKYESLGGMARSLSSEGMDVPAIVNKMFGQESVFDAITAGQYSSANLVKLLLEADL